MELRSTMPMQTVLRICALSAIAAAALLATGCASRSQAPVVERAPASGRLPPPPVAQPAATPGAPSGNARAETYIVKRGDTLFGIALDHGHDYKDVAAWNNIDKPDRISVGQALRMSPPAGAAVAYASAQASPVVPPQSIEMRPLALGSGGASAGAPAPSASGAAKNFPKTGKEPYSEQAANAGRKPDAQIAKVEPKPESNPDAAPAPGGNEEERLDWGWPAQGKTIALFSEATNKGVDIAGKLGDPVIASASGKVVYSGTGLRGYGKLIIIKHSANYLSAYAHNNNILVKEGQAVVKGQKIAEVGSTDADQPKLHFEIRRQGKPVDPLKYLPPERTS
jgi:lipoprotein NlpD